MLRTDPSSSWLFYKITPNIKLNHQAPINCWFYFIFGVFVYKMAIIHLESSRKLTNLRTNSFVRTIGVTQVSAILNYRRHFAEGMIWLALTLFRPASNWLILPAISLFKLSALPKYRRFQSTIKGAHFPVAVHSIPGAWPSKTSPLDLLNCCLDCCLDLFSGSSFKYLLFFFLNLIPAYDCRALLCIRLLFWIATLAGSFSGFAVGYSTWI